MAIVGSCNVSTATNGGAAVIWNAIDLLVNTAGTWSIDSSNDASAGSGNPVNSEGSLNNTNAWVVIKDSVVGRQILFVRTGVPGADAPTWTIKYDRAGTFTGGASGTPPSSLTEEQLINGTLFPATAGTYLAHAVCDDTAQTALFDVFPFWFGASLTGGSPTWSGGMSFFPCDFGMDASDADPVIMRAASTQNWMASSSWGKWIRWGLVGETWGSWSRFVVSNSSPAPDAYGRGYLGVPSIFYTFGSTNNGQLAFSSWAPFVSTQLNYPDTRDLLTGPSYVFAISGGGVNCILLPWPTGVTPLV